MRKFGIYMLYPPGVHLTHEGLGRLMIHFLKAVENKPNDSFVIACPSWQKQNLIEILENENINHHNIDIISPKKIPIFLSVFLTFKKYSQDYKSPLTHRWKKILKIKRKIYQKIESSALFSRIIGSRSIVVFSICILFFPVLQVINKSRKYGIKSKQFLHTKLSQSSFAIKCYSYAQNLLSNYKNILAIERAYSLLRQEEARLIHKLILKRTDVIAWFTPTAFWPEFNQIPGPKLLCVPDVVLSEFPVGYSGMGGNRFLNTYKEVENAINGASYFVTYSEITKYDTLVNRYHINSEKVFVIPHGANHLHETISITDSQNLDLATTAFCKQLLSASLRKAIDRPFGDHFVLNDLKFIFYASQFRPNKNILSLLRAYNYLLKKRYIGHKLILTGNPSVMPEIGQFIKDNHIENDVLCLYGLTSQELAACYKLADLAVNPSLSEGGFPFTFTEALSVDTPVVMARIPVTQEVITDLLLQQHMLFDAYDWKDIAHRIEWALKNKSFLLEQQKSLYEILRQRSWEDVVNDYINVLDHISQTHDAHGKEELTANQLRHAS